MLLHDTSDTHTNSRSGCRCTIEAHAERSRVAHVERGDESESEYEDFQGGATILDTGKWWRSMQLMSTRPCSWCFSKTEEYVETDR
jgi:hypothetical protein